MPWSCCVRVWRQWLAYPLILLYGSVNIISHGWWYTHATSSRMSCVSNCLSTLVWVCVCVCLHSLRLGSCTQANTLFRATFSSAHEPLIENSLLSSASVHITRGIFIQNINELYHIWRQFKHAFHLITLLIHNRLCAHLVMNDYARITLPRDLNAWMHLVSFDKKNSNGIKYYLSGCFNASIDNALYDPFVSEHALT